MKNKITMRPFTGRALLALVILSVNGCSINRPDSKVEQQGKQITELVQQSSHANKSISTEVVQLQKGIYLGAQVVQGAHGQPLPAALETQQAIRLDSVHRQTLNGVIQLIGQVTKIPVTFSDIARHSSPVAADGQAQQVAAAMSGETEIASVLADLNRGELMDVNYQGSLSGLLNQIANHFDIDWNYQDGRLIFSAEQTKVFNIAALNGSTSVSGSSSIGDTGGGSSEGGSKGDSGSGTQSVSSELKLNILASLKSALDGLVPAEQGKVLFSENDASVTVIARPSVIQRVGRYIKSVNREYERQVSVVFMAYGFSSQNDTTLGVDIKAMLSGGLELGSGNSFVSEALVGYTSPQGINAALSMLSKKGKVSTLSRATITTLSGRAVPLQISNTRGYVSSITRTEKTNDSNASTSINTASINAGFGMTILPKVLEDGKVLVKLSANMSSLVGKDNGFDVFGDKDKVMLPNVNQRTFNQENMLKNGKTLLLASFKDDRTSASDTGTFTAMFKLLGGATAKADNYDMVLITMTPYILDPDN